MNSCTEKKKSVIKEHYCRVVRHIQNECIYTLILSVLLNFSIYHQLCKDMGKCKQNSYKLYFKREP